MFTLLIRLIPRRSLKKNSAVSEQASLQAAFWDCVPPPVVILSVDSLAAVPSCQQPHAGQGNSAPWSEGGAISLQLAGFKPGSAAPAVTHWDLIARVLPRPHGNASLQQMRSKPCQNVGSIHTVRTKSFSHWRLGHRHRHD